VAALRKVAEAATPGPWVAEDGEVWRPSPIADLAVAEAELVRNAAYIAAASPDVVLGLLDRLDAAEAKVARVEALEPTWHRGMYGCPDDMFSRSALRAALTEEAR
jgi:uncharacterized protein YciI